MPSSMFRGVAVALIVTASTLLSGCAVAGTAVPGRTPNAGETLSPATADAFELTVAPAVLHGFVEGGSRAVLLVTITGSPTDAPATITATNTDGLVWADPVLLRPGVVGEVSVLVACANDCESHHSITRIEARRGATERWDARTVNFAPASPTSDVWDSGRAALQRTLETFMAWLETARPELGLGSATTVEAWSGSWDPYGVQHFQFFTKEWEIDLTWNNAPAPNDSCEIALRHRALEIAPSLAFRMDSVSLKTSPHATEPPPAVWR